MRSGALAIVVLAGCGDPQSAVASSPSSPIETPEVEADPQARARVAFLGDVAFRRAALERSLQNPDNGYSRDRLAAYAREQLGWELLPVWIPRAVPLTAAVLERVHGSTLVLPADTPAVYDGIPPTDEPGWRELGRRVFFELPLRADDSLAAALADPERARALGLFVADDGSYPGLVAFDDIDGTTRVGITCALCHTAAHEATAWPGLARRELDYGAARLDHQTRTGDPIAPELAHRMARWGPGRADITGDDDEDPVAIPDLWHLLELSTLTQAATVRLAGDTVEDPQQRAADDLVVLAIRQETQIIQAGGERTRPPRELAWALAMFVGELEPPPRAAAMRSAAADHGATLFASHCAQCHHGASKGGTAIDAAAVGTDRALADSRARGTGKLRVAPLVAVAGAAPYFHDGSAASLAAVLDPARLADGYTAGVRGPGPIPGHRFGTELVASDRAALVAYLATL
jgi:mono/diheme cytochrome c family protein